MLDSLSYYLGKVWNGHHQPICPLGQAMEFIVYRPELWDLLESFKIAALWFGLFLVTWYTISMAYWLVVSRTRFQSWFANPMSRQHFASKVMSMGHAIACIYLSLAPLYNGPHWTDVNTPAQTFLMQVSLGYFWADLVYICFLEPDWMFLVHHGAMIAYWATCLYIGKGGYYGLVAVLPGELSNPLQIVWDYARRYKYRKLFSALTPVYTYLFIFLRCLVIPAIGPYMLYHIWGYCTAPPIFRIIWISAAFIMMIAGWVWSYMIWRGYCKFCQIQRGEMPIKTSAEVATKCIEATIRFKIDSHSQLAREKFDEQLRAKLASFDLVSLKFDPVENTG